jgi:hypothetical protein
VNYGGALAIGKLSLELFFLPLPLMRFRFAHLAVLVELPSKPPPRLASFLKIRLGGEPLEFRFDCGQVAPLNGELLAAIFPSSKDD